MARIPLPHSRMRSSLALALSFAMLAVVPLDGFREFAFMMGVGILVETFVVRSLLIPALISLFGRSGAWPGRLLEREPAPAPLARPHSRSAAPHEMTSRRPPSESALR